jgi:hypothetical protein
LVVAPHAQIARERQTRWQAELAVSERTRDAVGDFRHPLQQRQRPRGSEHIELRVGVLLF